MRRESRIEVGKVFIGAANHRRVEVAGKLPVGIEAAARIQVAACVENQVAFCIVGNDRRLFIGFRFLCGLACWSAIGMANRGVRYRCYDPVWRWMSAIHLIEVVGDDLVGLLGLAGAARRGSHYLAGHRRR